MEGTLFGLLLGLECFFLGQKGVDFVLETDYLFEFLGSFETHAAWVVVEMAILGLVLLVFQHLFPSVEALSHSKELELSVGFVEIFYELPENISQKLD